MMNKKKYADGGQQQLFAYKDIPLTTRMANYFSNLITFDHINNVEDIVGERGLTFTLHDPVYGGEKFSPAIIGNGTTHKYLLYCDSKFPFVHQNIVTINLGTSYTVNQGVDVFSTMTSHQGSYIKSTDHLSNRSCGGECGQSAHCNLYAGFQRIQLIICRPL
ncbi:MAG: hypothetical protein ACLVCH_08345 [Roseburia inulinivorans]